MHAAYGLRKAIRIAGRTFIFRVDPEVGFTFQRIGFVELIEPLNSLGLFNAKHSVAVHLFFIRSRFFSG